MLFPYAGNKSTIAAEILPYFPSTIQDYWEPFCGTCTIAYRLQDRIQGNIYLSDTNRQMIYFFRSLATPLALLEEVYKLYHCPELPDWEEPEADRILSFLKGVHAKISTCYNGESDTELRTRLREGLNRHIREDSASYLVQGAIFYVVQRLAHSGVYRVNKKGSFNVPLTRSIAEPFKPSHWQKILDWSLPASFDTHPYWASPYNPRHSESLIYVDPPYLGADQNYSAAGFDQERLVQWIATRTCKVIASNSIEALPLYASLPGTVHFIDRPDRVGRAAAKREILYVSH